MTIAKHLEHTLLKPEATVEDIMQLCSEARKYGLFGVCVRSRLWRQKWRSKRTLMK